MTRILLISDSHKMMANTIRAVEESQPDMICHMGDCYGDAEALQKEYPDIPIQHVLGNCDWDEGPTELLFEVEGRKIMICHGHEYNVKYSLLSLMYAAKEKGAQIVVFGHTHKLYYDLFDGLFIINPGSISQPPAGIEPSYAVLTISEDLEKQPSLETFFLE